MAYTTLNLPKFTPLSQKEGFKEYLDVMEDTAAAREKYRHREQDSLARTLDRIPGLTDIFDKTRSTLTSLLSGKPTRDMEDYLKDEAAGLAYTKGVGQGGGAGINMSLASLGREGLRMQEKALSMVPQIAGMIKSTFMGNIMDSYGSAGPGKEYTSQLQADHRDVYESVVAQEKAKHAAEVANEQLRIQEQARADELARLNMVNAGGFGGSVGGPSTYGPSGGSYFGAHNMYMRQRERERHAGYARRRADTIARSNWGSQLFTLGSLPSQVRPTRPSFGVSRATVGAPPKPRTSKPRTSPNPFELNLDF